MALAGIVTTGSVKGSSQTWSVWTSSAGSLSCGMKARGTGVGGASISEAAVRSDGLSCVPSLQEEGNNRDHEWLPMTPLMAEAHKPLLG